MTTTAYDDTTIEALLALPEARQTGESLPSCPNQKQMKIRILSNASHNAQVSIFADASRVCVDVPRPVHVNVGDSLEARDWGSGRNLLVTVTAIDSPVTGDIVLTVVLAPSVTHDNANH